VGRTVRLYSLRLVSSLRSSLDRASHSRGAAKPSLPRSPQPADWVEDLLTSSRQSIRGGIRVRESDRFALISASASVPGTNDGARIENASAEAYDAIGELLQKLEAPHPIRIWNFVPRILGPGGNGMDRYMRFNAGRYQAFERWFGGTGRFDRVLPAASAVGYSGDQLVIHALSCREPGVPVVNPRQVAPHLYSRRFGPLPPCFARATRVMSDDGRSLLLVGGTSSVRGEDSVFTGDPLAQLRETLENLATLVREAFGHACHRDPLSHFRRLRVYHVPSVNPDTLRAHIAPAFDPSTQIEWMAADLCRSDLTIEIEGLAEKI